MNSGKLGKKQVFRWFSSDIYEDLGLTRSAFISEENRTRALLIYRLLAKNVKSINVDPNDNIFLSFLSEYISVLIMNILLCTPDDSPSFGVVVIYSARNVEYFIEDIPNEDEDEIHMNSYEYREV